MPIKSFKQYIKEKEEKKKAPVKASESVKVVPFKDWLGGGSYTVGPDKNKIYPLPRGYGGIDSQKGMQRDHQFPVSLGGSSQKDNIKPKPLETAKKKDNVLMYALSQYRSGKIGLGQARNMVINWENTDIPGQQAESKKLGGSQNTLSNFVRSLPSAFGKVGEVISAPVRAIADKVTETSQKVLEPVGERIGSVFRSVQTKSLTPLKESLAQQKKTLLPEKDDSEEVALGKNINLALMYSGSGKKIGKPKTVQKVQEVLNPAKQLDTETQKIYSDFTRKKLVAKEAANEQLAKIKVPEKEGLKTILDYEKGQAPNIGIKRTFDTLRKEAIDKGLNVKYRENYLPQVYKDKPQKVNEAVAKYLKDEGVEQKIIDDYISGKSELPEVLSNRLKLNPSFSKQRVLPDYETAMKYGLTPKYTNPAQLAAHYKNELEKTVANREFISDLLANDKISPTKRANWKPVEIPGQDGAFYAEPKLAKMLEGLYRDENALTFAQTLAKGLGAVSKKAQEITLSAGVPKTSINFFSIGQLVKEVTAGNVKALSAFVRSNSNNATVRYFQKNQPVLKKMANQGLDIGARVGSFETAYKGMRAGSAVQKFKQVLGEGWDKAFNEKTFASFMPQLHTQTFKDAYSKALKKGLPEAEAEKFAGDVTKNMFGLFEDVGRGKTTDDVLSATFFAPKFREGIIRTLFNTAKSITTEIRNPTFYRNRRLVVGMAITYAAYNALNKKLNGSYMWDNEPGKEFALKIPRENGEVVYLEFMPSFLAFARNMASGGIAAVKGDFKTSAQKFGSVFSMPVKIASEVIGNKDYFGSPIYKDTDNTDQKLSKIAQHVGLQVNHPFIKETIKQVITEQDKPIHQSVITAMELPLKFSSQDKITKAKFYDAQAEQQKARVKEREQLMPVYTKVQDLLSQGKDAEAQHMVDQLSDEDYELYKSLKTSEKRKATIEGQARLSDTVKKVQDLINQGKQAEAQSIVDSLSDEDYRLYQLAKNKFNP